MNRAILKGMVLIGVLALGGLCVQARDWPQWRGPNRDARASDFKAPKTWPKTLTQKWKVTVGDGVATPALVGDRLYVFSRQGGEEIIRCLKADTGKEVWAQKYKAATIGGPARGYPGPRCSPTVADGKVVTISVHGSLTCYDADTGKELWRKDDFKGSVPGFYTSSSPLIVDKLCIAQLGGRDGAIVAYELATGKQKWKWTGDSTAYASPALLTLGQTKVVIAETGSNLVAVGANDGKALWKTGYRTKYNASTPMVDGENLIIAGSGKGTKAFKMEKKDDEVKATQLWSNDDQSVIYNTPVIKDGLLYGLSENSRLFCLSMKDGKKAWDASLGGGGRGSTGYGSVVDVGTALMALTPAGVLIVFEPGDKAYTPIMKYEVGKRTYAYPVASGNRIFIKDDNSVTLWVVEE